jgi:preprotein translocase subunit SecE
VDPVGAFFQELMHVGIYKRSQGRITRQVTFFALAIAVALGAWRLSAALTGTWENVLDWLHLSGLAWLFTGFDYWFPALLGAAGLWISYRMVNLPSFADFLIAVEAEMNKVSWPSRSELFRASLVVLFTIFALAGTLWLFDMIWRIFFSQVLRL